MKQKKTILIFGISSFLGSNLAEQLKDEYRVVGTYFNTPVSIPGIMTIRCDVHNKDRCQKVVFLFKPDITIYAVGLTDIHSCQEFPKVADALNTAGVFNVSMASERYHSKFIYFSSSYIFSGEDILFRETDTPMPTSVYGNTLASAEFYIQKSCLNYIIFRCCPLFGRSLNPMDIKFIEAIERREVLGERIVCDNKVTTGFLDMKTIATILKASIEKNITNRLFQLDSKSHATRYEFAQMYFDVFGGNSSLLVKGDWKFPQTENQLATQNLGDELCFRMFTGNIESELEISLPTIEESLKQFRQTLFGGVRFKKKENTGISFI